MSKTTADVLKKARLVLVTHDFDYGWIIEELREGEYEQLDPVQDMLTPRKSKRGRTMAIADAFRYCEANKPAVLRIHGDACTAVIPFTSAIRSENSRKD